MSNNLGIVNDVNIRNRRASYEYLFLDTYVAGIILKGTEIKAIRMGLVQISDSYCYFDNGELFVANLHISEYYKGTVNNHEPDRVKKLLLSRREINKLEDKLKDRGLTVIPTRLFTTDRGLVKLEIVLAKGKKLYDKRESIKDRDIKRDIEL